MMKEMSRSGRCSRFVLRSAPFAAAAALLLAGLACGKKKTDTTYPGRTLAPTRTVPVVRYTPPPIPPTATLRPGQPTPPPDVPN
jgi:hypothetical protein